MSESEFRELKSGDVIDLDAGDGCWIRGAKVKRVETCSLIVGDMTHVQICLGRSGFLFWIKDTSSHFVTLVRKS